eukprot:COSAG03_NODE_17110_length_384_cov_0.543860_1_plen_37_part_01
MNSAWNLPISLITFSIASSCGRKVVLKWYVPSSYPKP